MLKRRLAAAASAAACVAGLIGVPPLAGAADAAPPPTVQDIPVSFQVQNVNRSLVACGSDGLTYTVRGDIVGRPADLAKHSAATLLLHAVTLGEYYWNLPSPSGYDFADQMARNGHVSVIIDRLGYGRSGHPQGYGTCYGSEADVAHQIVGQLRHGTYQTGSGSPAAFPQVYLGGSSVGGLITNIEAYSFHDVNGIINFSWGDEAVTAFTVGGTANVVARCLLGGDPGTPGYAAFFRGQRDQFYFVSASPQVRQDVPGLHVDPCGQIASIPAGVASDLLYLGTINVPVLVVFGADDPVFGPQPLAAQLEALRYSGSPNVSLSLIPDAGHYPLFDSTHLQVVATVNGWLNARAH